MPLFYVALFDSRKSFIDDLFPLNKIYDVLIEIDQSPTEADIKTIYEEHADDANPDAGSSLLAPRAFI